MPLELQDRQLGRVVVVKAAGRIVAGPEAQKVESHLSKLHSDCRDLVLDVAEVSFIDSSGLGTLVRLVARIRRSGGDLKLCAAPPPVSRERSSGCLRGPEFPALGADKACSSWSSACGSRASSPR